MLCPHMKCILIVNLCWIVSINAQYREETNDYGITVVALKTLDDNMSAENNYTPMNNKYSNDQNSKELVQREDILENDINYLESNNLTGFFDENADLAHDLPQNTRRYINDVISNGELARIKEKHSFKDFQRMTDTNVTKQPEVPPVIVEDTKVTEQRINVTDTNQDIVLHKILEIIKEAHLKFTREIANKSEAVITETERTEISDIEYTTTSKPPVSIDKTSEVPPKTLIELIIKHEYPNSIQPQNQHNPNPQLNNLNSNLNNLNSLNSLNNLNNNNYPHYVPSVPLIPPKYPPQNQFPFVYQDPIIKHLLNTPKPVYNPFYSYAPPHSFRPHNFFPMIRSINEDIVPQKPRYLPTNNFDFFNKT